ncbi:hypothetical protein SOVF_149830 isoform A [Spinacia oleracea]|uniref:Uncharacterized protein isoform X1 n=1 Tax=Spinacia oleracea TaxID=3562 RepID=A0A9R0K721_SPIOL|nr:uncharacterized protein LOC110798957 isoform X1 [Spinacia oleracea]KNA09845.1 hypothetical protein SOVF_149830 isoform A [Spinacia oleracea]
MSAEEENYKRQRFYIELKPGETTIISWKKLLRKATEKDQRGPHLPSSSSSTALETSRRVMDGYHDGGQYNDSFIRNKNAKHINRVTSSGRRVKITKIGCDKNDDHSSIKHAEAEKLSAKATSKTSSLLDETLRCSSFSSHAMVKDHRPEELQLFTVDAPVLTSSEKSASVCSKSKCPPLNAIEDASVFPLKTTHNVQKKTPNISSEEIKVGVGSDSSDVVHQNFEGRCVPVKNSPTSGILMRDKVSSKSRHNDKSGGSWGHVDAVSLGYKSSLKDSLAKLRPEKVMDHHTLTEALSRAKSIRALADQILSRNMVDDVLRNPDRIPCQKRKVTESSNNTNPIPSCPRKKAPKKPSAEHPIIQTKSSCPLTKSVKPTSKQKQQIPEKTNLKVRFLLKQQEHQTLKSNEQSAKDALNHSRVAASLTFNQPS